MVFARTGDNDFSTARIIVAPTISAGATHTSISQAISDASSSGITVIFIKPGTYTENLTLLSGIDLVSYGSCVPNPSSLGSRPLIIGKMTANIDGIVNIYGLQLRTNSDFILQSSGAHQSRISFENCHFYCINNTGISYAPTSSGSYLRLLNCQAELINSNIFLAASSLNASSTVNLYNLQTTSADSTSAASTISSGSLEVFYSKLNFPITTSGTSSFSSTFSFIDTSLNNSTCLTIGGSGTNTLSHSKFSSGTASAISIGATASLDECSVNSSNANAITGAGTINFSPIDFIGSSSTINTSTKNPFPSGVEMGGTGASSLTGVLTGNGTSAVTANPVTQHGVVIGGASNAVTSTSAGTAGQFLTGNGAGNDPTFAASVLGFYGDGSDGSQTFDGSSVVLGITPVANVYTLTRDIFLSSGTINSGVFITTNGYRVFCNGTLTNNGTIQWNGNNGSASGTAGTGITNSGSTINSTANVGTPGGAGQIGAGSVGTNITNSYGGAGGAGGAGASSGGTPGTLTAPLSTTPPPRFLPSVVTGQIITGPGATVRIFCGSGGGGGGGDGSVAGGGGGGGAGIVIVSALIFAGTGSITANGGNGGSPSSGTNNGGGGGGGGGVVLVTSRSVSSGSISGQTIIANGGIGGTGFGSGQSGSNGNAGTVILVRN